MRHAFNHRLKSELCGDATPVGHAIALDMLKQQYRLSVQVHDWPISTELDKWMAEISAWPGCRAWGDTPREAIEIISDLAVGFIRDGITENTLPPVVNPVELTESAAEYFLVAGVGGLHGGDVLRGALCHHLPALVGGAGAHVDYPVSVFDHVQVVLDENYRVARVHQPVQHVQ